MSAPTAGWPVICTSCGERGSVGRITAGLRHRCGGTVDLWLNSTSQQRLVAATAPGAGFDEWMAHRVAGWRPTASGNHSGEEDSRSGEYAGPMPGPNPSSNGEGRITCPTCHGSGADPADTDSGCRECGGSGSVTPTTTPRDRWNYTYQHQYPSTQTKVPFMGRRRTDAAARTRSEMCRKVAAANPGLHPGEVAWLVDRTLAKYPEVR